MPGYSEPPNRLTDPYGRFMRMSDVEETVGLKRSKIYELMNDPVDPFPSPIHIGKVSRWVEREIIAWKEKRLQMACRYALSE